MDLDIIGLRLMVELLPGFHLVVVAPVSITVLLQMAIQLLPDYLILELEHKQCLIIPTHLHPVDLV